MSERNKFVEDKKREINKDNKEGNFDYPDVFSSLLNLDLEDSTVSESCPSQRAKFTLSSNNTPNSLYMPSKNSQMDDYDHKLSELDNDFEFETLGNKLDSSTFTSYLNNNPIQKYFNSNRNEGDTSRIDSTPKLTDPYDFIKTKTKEENKHPKKKQRSNNHLNIHYKGVHQSSNNMNGYHQNGFSSQNMFNPNVYAQNKLTHNYPQGHNNNTFLKMNLKMNVVNCPSFYVNDKMVTGKMFQKTLEGDMRQTNYTQVNYNDGVNYQFQLNNQIKFPMSHMSNQYPINNNFNYQFMPQFNQANMPMGSYNFPYAENKERERDNHTGSHNKQTTQNFNVNINNNVMTPYPQDEAQSKTNDSRQQKHLTMLQKCKSLDIKNLAKLAPKIARDQAGCRFLQKKMDEAPEIANTLIYAHVIESIADLMTDTFGNYLVQKLLEHITEEKLIQLMAIISPNLQSVGTNTHGTRVMQKLVEKLNSDELILSFLSIIKPSIVNFLKDVNANHIILKFINLYGKTHHAVKIYEVIIDSLNEVAMNKNGCVALQRLISSAHSDIKPRLIDSIIENCRKLIIDKYGNYVIQFVIGLKEMKIANRVVKCLLDDIVYFSKHKFSSNAVEKCFNICDKSTLRLLLDSLKKPEVINELIFDMYGNYVIQKLLQCSQSDERLVVLKIIAPSLKKLRLLPFGQKLYSKLLITYPQLSSFMLIHDYTPKVTHDFNLNIVQDQCNMYNLNFVERDDSDSTNVENNVGVYNSQN